MTLHVVLNISDALADACKAIDLNPQNVKAHLRKG